MMFCKPDFGTFKDEDKMLDDKISILEKKVLAASDEEFYRSMLADSDMDSFFKCLDLLKKELTPASRNQIQKFIDREKSVSSSNSRPLTSEVKFKYLLTQIEKTKDGPERRKLLKMFNDLYLGENISAAQNTSTLSAKGEPLTSTKANADGGKQSQNQLLQSKIVADFISSGIYSKDINHSLLNSISQHELLRVDLSKLLKSNLYHFESLLSKVTCIESFPKAVKILKDYFQLMSSNSSSFSISSNLLKKLSVDTMEKLAKESTVASNQVEFMSVLISKRFEVDTYWQEHMSSPQKKIELFKAIIEYLKQFPGHVSKRLTQEMQAAEMQTRKDNLLLTVKDLENYLATKPPYQGYYIFGSYKNEFPLINQVTLTSSVKIPIESLDLYVIALATELVDNSEGMARLEKVADLRKLTTEIVTERLMRGHQVQNVMSYFSEFELNALRDRRMLKLSKLSNRKSFGNQEPVELSIQIKNIRNLLVSVFEINTYNYYSQANCDFDATIDVSGLVPSIQTKYEYSQPPIVRHTEKFEFSEISKADRGLYIVEFIGDGLCSRAVIKKGGLTLIDMSEGDEHRFVILDEQKKVCTGKETLLEINNRKYEADSEGNIVFPRLEANLDGRVLVSYKGFVEPYSLSLPKPSYVIDFSVVLNEEQLCGGQTCSFWIAPKIFVNDSVASISSTSKLSASIHCTTSDNVKHCQNYSDLSTTDNERILLDYRVPFKAATIVVSLTAEIDPEGDQTQKITISQSKNINLTRPNKQLNKNCDLFLRRSAEGGYLVYLLGLNSEPFANQEIKLTLKFSEVAAPEITTLITDSEGKVSLGNLQAVEKLIANTRTESNYQATQEWQIEILSRYLNVPDSLDVVEGEDLMLPAVDSSKTPRYRVYFQRTNPDFASVVSDCAGQIEKNGETMFLTKLKVGYYLVTYILGSVVKTVKMTVSRGTRWELSRDFIITDSSVKKLLNQSNYLAISDLKLSQTELKLKVHSNQPDFVQVSVLGFSSFPNNLEQILSTLKSTTVTESSLSFEINRSANYFLYEKELSDEVKYVVERQNREIFLGNTLERPTGLLTKQFNMKTQPDSEFIGQTKYFVEIWGESIGKTLQVSRPKCSRQGSVGSLTFNLTNKFLDRRGKIAYGNTDVDGSCSVDIKEIADMDCYVVLIEDKNNFVYTVLRSSSPPLKPTTTDVFLKSARNSQSIFLHKRTSYTLTKEYDPLISQYAANLEFNGVCNLGDLFDIISGLTQNPELSQWSFLKNWQGMEQAEKAEFYEKFACHELNLFLLFKDPEFLHTVVRPHLSNKTRKEFIDWVVLGQTEELRKISKNIVELSQLMPWEIFLLVHHFAKVDAETAKSLAKYLQFRSEASPELDPKDYKARFDSVLRFSRDAQIMEDESRTLGSKAHTSTLMTMTASTSKLQAEPIDPDLYSRGGGGAMGTRMYGRRSQKVSKPKDKGFRQIGTTYEYKERNYYYEPDKVGQYSWQFWADLATGALSTFSLAGVNPASPQRTLPGVLLSEKFICSGGSMAECLITLAVQDLPFKSQGLLTSNERSVVKIKAQDCCILFYKELQEINPSRTDIEILVSQKFYDPEDCTETEEDGTTRLKTASVFKSCKVYAFKVAISNTSSVDRTVDLLTEVPQGSIPINSENYFHSRTIHLSCFTTQVFDYYFYFPAPGQFDCYPATVIKEDKVVSSADIRTPLSVQAQIEKREVKSIDDYIQRGATDKVLEYLREQNFVKDKNFRMDKLSRFVHCEKFFRQAVQILRSRMIFDKWLWSHSLHHGGDTELKEYFENKFRPNKVLEYDGFSLYYLNSNLIHVDSYRPTEYYPLVNPRAHYSGRLNHNISNKEFQECYLGFLKYLVDKPVHHSRDKFQLAIYLLAQDRVQDALSIADKIDPQSFSDGELKMQMDYFKAMSSLYQVGCNLEEVKKICQNYTEYPIKTWRDRFLHVAAIILECQGKERQNQGRLESASARNLTQAESEPKLKAEVEGNSIRISSANIDEVSVQLFIVDIEVKFSIDPFGGSQQSTFGFVKPNYTSTVVVASSGPTPTVTSYKIPEELSNHNLTIQVKTSSDAKPIFLNYLPSTLKVLTNRQKGVLQVLHGDSTPVEKAYVKVFADWKRQGIKFYKDGYTDFLGYFDYSTLNLENPNEIKTFSLLVLGSNPEEGSKLVKVEGGLVESESTSTNTSGESYDSSKADSKISVEAKVLTLQKELETQSNSKYLIAFS